MTRSSLFLSSWARPVKRVLLISQNQLSKKGSLRYSRLFCLHFCSFYSTPLLFCFIQTPASQQSFLFALNNSRMFVFIFCFWNVTERSRAGFSSCKQWTHRWQGRGSLGAGALVGTERAHEDKTPTGSCRGGNIGRQEGARGRKSQWLSLSQWGLAALFYLKILPCLASKHSCCKGRLFLLPWQTDWSGACPRKQLSHLAPPVWVTAEGCSHWLLWKSQLEQFFHKLLAARQCQWVRGYHKAWGGDHSLIFENTGLDLCPAPAWLQLWRCLLQLLLLVIPMELGLVFVRGIATGNYC